MILEKLIEYARKAKDNKGNSLLGDMAFPPPEKEIHYTIKVANDGQCRGISPLNKFYRCPAIGDRASEKQAALLCDTTPYVFGDGDWSKKSGQDNSAKHRENRKTFLKVLRDASKQLPKEAALKASILFCDKSKADILNKYKIKPKPGDRFAFELDSDNGVLAFERETLKNYWRELTKKRGDKRLADVDSMACLSCGEIKSPVKTHEITINGIPGGHKHKKSCKLISFDKPAFRSHDLEQSLNAPMCQDCVNAYTLGLNNLLQGNSTHYACSDAGIVYVFWSKKETEFDLNATLIQAEPEHLKKLYAAPYSPGGAAAVSPDDVDAFYVLALSASGARAMIRDWSETHVLTLQSNIRQWFNDLSIIIDRPWPGKKSQQVDAGAIFGKFPLWKLIRSIGVKKDKGYYVKPQLAASLFKAAIRGEFLHESILAAVMRRVHIEGDVTPERAALLKLMLNRIVRQRKQGGNEMPEVINENNCDPAYVCGRLLAVLERLQYHAVGAVNASIIDRFFGAASTAPRIVFPRLIRSAEHHLGKLRGEKPGLATNIQKDLETVSSKLGCPEIWKAEFPAILDLEEQGRFALGFYHQRAAYRNKPHKTEVGKTANESVVN